LAVIFLTVLASDIIQLVLSHAGHHHDHDHDDHDHEGHDHDGHDHGEEEFDSFEEPAGDYGDESFGDMGDESFGEDLGDKVSRQQGGEVYEDDIDEPADDSADSEPEPDPATPYKAPALKGNFVFFDTFDKSFTEKWVVSKNPKYSGTWEWGTGDKPVGIPGDKGLIVGNVARHHGIAAKFDKALDNTGKTLVVQYEVKLTHGLDCGGAYMKLLKKDDSIKMDDFADNSPYIIMFGPDKCGTTNKVHFIFRHKNPKTGVYEEKHLKNPPAIKTDKLTHLYTLVVEPDNKFELFIDLESARKGDLLSDFEPSVNPPKTIPDPTDKKPSDWVDIKKIPDPDATKPDDWDESQPLEIEDPDAKKPDDWQDNELEFITDPQASKPDDWDEEEDGKWEPPQIPNPKCEAAGCGEWKRPKIRNPKYKGKWSAPLIDNPAYKGEWKAKEIPNPDWFEDLAPHNFEPMGAIGFELWTMSDGIKFDNILIGHDAGAAKDFAEQTFSIKQAAEDKAKKSEEKKAGDAAKKADPSTGKPQKKVPVTLKEKVLDAIEQATELAKKNPSVAIGTGLLGFGIILLVLTFSFQSKKHTPIASRSPEPSSSEEPTTKAETESEAEVTEDEKAKDDIQEEPVEKAEKPKGKRKTTKKVAE